MSTSNWPEMYALAEEILAIAPWKSYFEEDLFAIQPRRDGTIYFVSVMGSAGEHHAIAYYPGLEGLSRFKMSQMEDIPDSLRMELMLCNGHLQVGFGPKKFLTPDDIEVLSATGKKYRGKWPVFRSHRAARVPWITSPEEAAELLLLMKQTLIVLNRKGENLLRPCDEEEFFLRTWDDKDSICRLDDLRADRQVIQSTLPAGALDGVKKKSVRFEAELIVMPTPIEDVPPGEPPYFPLLLLVAETGSGFVLGTELITTKDGIDAAYARIPEALAGILRKGKALPKIIVARHPILISALEGFQTACGIQCEFDEELDAIDDALESLMEFMESPF